MKRYSFYLPWFAYPVTTRATDYLSAYSNVSFALFGGKPLPGQTTYMED